MRFKAQLSNQKNNNIHFRLQKKMLPADRVEAVAFELAAAAAELVRLRDRVHSAASAAAAVWTAVVESSASDSFWSSCILPHICFLLHIFSHQRRRFLFFFFPPRFTRELRQLALSPRGTGFAAV
jgi:hypothetical protein